eukprot:11881946-Alexandrium_andersonii.AAC.1
MGSRYYRELRAKYSSAANPVNALKVTDASTPSKEVFNHMLSCKRHPVNRAPLIAYLGTAAQPNMSELVGILRWCLELNPTVSQDQLRGCVEVVRWCTRLDLKTKWPEQIALCSKKFNDALVQALSSSKRSR